MESNKEKYYETTIKWSDNGNIEDGKILKKVLPDKRVINSRVR